jgi:hypothetical protein
LSTSFAGLSRCVSQTVVGSHPFTCQQDAFGTMGVKGRFCSARLNDDVSLPPIVKSVALPPPSVLFEKTVETVIAVLGGLSRALDHQGG